MAPAGTLMRGQYLRSHRKSAPQDLPIGVLALNMRAAFLARDGTLGFTCSGGWAKVRFQVAGRRFSLPWIQLPARNRGPALLCKQMRSMLVTIGLYRAENLHAIRF